MKTKLITKDELDEMKKLKLENNKKGYDYTKKIAIKYTNDMTKHLLEWNNIFNGHKKQDDLADAFLQGIYFYECQLK